LEGVVLSGTGSCQRLDSICLRERALVDCASADRGVPVVVIDSGRQLCHATHVAGIGEIAAIVCVQMGHVDRTRAADVVIYSDTIRSGVSSGVLTCEVKFQIAVDP